MFVFLLCVVILAITSQSPAADKVNPSPGKVIKSQSAAQKPSADWPHWRGPTYNGISTETGWNDSWSDSGPKILWRVSLGNGASSVSISENRLYTMGNINDHDFVYCFNASTGDQIWKHSYPAPVLAKAYEGGPNSTPAVAGPHIYTLSKHGDLFCLDKISGNVVWSKNLRKELDAKNLEWGFAGSPLVTGNLVIVNIGTSGVAMDKNNGNIIWQNGNDQPGFSTPVPYKKNDKDCVIIMNKTSAVALTVSDGKEVWQVPWDAYGMNVADAIITDDDKLFICSGYGKGCALYDIAKETPTELWKNRNLKSQYSSSVIWDGHIYGFDGNMGESGRNWTAGRFSLRCLELNTGKVKWKKKGLGLGSLMLADGKLIILTVEGRLVIARASPDAYNEISNAKVLEQRCWAVPVLLDKKLYIRNGRGDLLCLDVSKK